MIACASLDLFEPILYNKQMNDNRRHSLAELAVDWNAFFNAKNIATSCNVMSIVGLQLFPTVIFYQITARCQTIWLYPKFNVVS